jgi:hypothetical protein
MTTASQGIEIRTDLADCHAAMWQHIAGPGTWWTAQERLAIAEEARLARDCGLCAERKAAVSPFSVDGEHESAGSLPAPVIDVIHRIITDPGRLTKSWLSGVVDGELADTHYVELVAVAVFTHSLDVFQRALGFDRASLPAPRSGEPTRVRPESARPDGAWVDLVPDGEEGGAFSREIYGGMESVPYIGRALSLVPAEVAALRGLSGPHYMELSHVADPRYETPGREIDRLQMELVASRVSLMNDCFY